MNETTKPQDRTEGRLDRAVIAYREDPSEINRQRLMLVQEEHYRAFMAEQTGDFILRTS